MISIGGRTEPPSTSSMKAPSRRVEQERAGLGQSPADHATLGVDHRHQVGQAEGQPPPELVEHAQCTHVAGDRGPGDVLAVHVLGVPPDLGDHMGKASRVGSLPGQPPEASARRVALPTTPLATRTERAGRVDDHVADLAGEAR